MGINKTPDVYGELYEACRNLPCVLQGHPDHVWQCTGGGDAHHVKRVGAGGKDKENLVPMCRHLHSMCHGHVYGITERDVEKTYGIDLKKKAVEIYQDLIGQSSHSGDFPE